MENTTSIFGSSYKHITMSSLMEEEMYMYVYINNYNVGILKGLCKEQDLDVEYRV